MGNRRNHSSVRVLSLLGMGPHGHLATASLRSYLALQYHSRTCTEGCYR